MIVITAKINKAPIEDHEIDAVLHGIAADINADYDSGDVIANGNALFGHWEMSLTDRAAQRAAQEPAEVTITITLSDDALEEDRDVDNIMNFVRKGINSGAGEGEIELYEKFLGQWEITYGS